MNILDKHLLSGIEVSKPVSRILSKHQSSKMKSKEEIADNIAHLIISIPEITIGEISRQIGHAAGILGYDSSLWIQILIHQRKLVIGLPFLLNQ
ncbi:hypothetical protein JS565_21125 [Salmonella enterica subsp. enterica serovar Senftenberg]|nr:hypothetical protein [Salmonella enterica subsp. enterica serovar Senftenberg]